MNCQTENIKIPEIMNYHKYDVKRNIKIYYQHKITQQRPRLLFYQMKNNFSSLAINALCVKYNIEFCN